MTNPQGSIAAPDKGGLFEDLIEVLFAPSKVFERSRAAKALMYALVTAVIVGAIMFATKNLLQPWFEAQTDLALKLAAAKGKAIPEQAVGSMRKFSAWSIIIGAPVTMLVGPYLNAVLILLGAKLTKVNVNYGQAALIATLGGVPRILGWLMMPVQSLVLDSTSARGLADLSVGPARFVDPVAVPQAILALLSNLDVFRLWQIALIAIGVSVVGRVSKGSGALVAIIMFGITVILQLLPSALM